MPCSEFPDDKGKWNGSCNRKMCLAPGAMWWNRSTEAYYCTACMKVITRYPENADLFTLHRENQNATEQPQLQPK